MDWNSKLNAGCLCIIHKLVPWGHSKWIFWEKTCCWLVLMYSGNSLVLYYQFCCKKCPFKLCLVYVRSCRQNIETMRWSVSRQKDATKQNSQHYTSMSWILGLMIYWWSSHHLKNSSFTTPNLVTLFLHFWSTVYSLIWSLATFKAAAQRIQPEYIWESLFWYTDDIILVVQLLW